VISLPFPFPTETSNTDYGSHSGVYAYGFERPSAIQQRAIMPVIKGMLTALFLA
jgi:hypothetical protein